MQKAFEIQKFVLTLNIIQDFIAIAQPNHYGGHEKKKNRKIKYRKHSLKNQFMWKAIGCFENLSSDMTDGSSDGLQVDG